MTHIYVCCLRERRRSRTIAAFFDTLGQEKNTALKASVKPT
jgi:hypothetical protein